MNAEYLGQVVKRLFWLSEYLISERDPTSSNYYENHMKFIFERVQKIIELTEEARNLDRTAILTSELYMDPWLMSHYDLANRIETDPFLPRQIRKNVAQFYSDRTNEMGTIYGDVMSEFCIDLFYRKVIDTNLDLKIHAWAKLGEAYVDNGWGSETNIERIRALRAEIEEYLSNLS
jgi:adenylate cyclase